VLQSLQPIDINFLQLMVIR